MTLLWRLYVTWTKHRKCRKSAGNCRKLSWHLLSRPLPAVPFWLSPAQTMKCTLWTETLEFRRLKVPTSRFALHNLTPPYFTVSASFLPLIHGLSAFFRLLLTPVPAAPFCQPLSSRFALHGPWITVYAALSGQQTCNNQRAKCFSFSLFELKRL